jgi:uncharacterized protein YodC (DUF2158 family)
MSSVVALCGIFRGIAWHGSTIIYTDGQTLMLIAIWCDEFLTTMFFPGHYCRWFAGKPISSSYFHKELLDEPERENSR